MTAITTRIGRAVGWVIAPVFGLVSKVRHARTFHPRGPIYHASIERHRHTPPGLYKVARRLEGEAIVRFSGALWKNAEVIDVLGCAIRFRKDPIDSETPSAEDQDLLFATIRRPWTMAVAPLTTDVHDYLGNDYFAVSPFDIGIGRLIYFRLHPRRPSAADGTTREQRLNREVEHGEAILDLEVGEKPFGPWEPVLSITLERQAQLDGEALRFRPFRHGRGVRPRGFIHALRLGVYAMSQRARPART